MYPILQSELQYEIERMIQKYDNNNNLSGEKLLKSAQWSRFQFLIVYCLQMAQ
jgi:hypothetical protein